MAWPHSCRPHWPPTPSAATSSSSVAAADDGRAAFLAPSDPSVWRNPFDVAVDSLLTCTIARRLAALSGGRLDAWLLPDGGLRARLILGGA